MHESGTATATVVCVHGAGGGGWEWALWSRVLAARGHAVLAPDLVPGRDGLAETAFEDYRGQVADWCQAIRSGPRILAGASLGGLLALAAAVEAKPTAMILVNPLPPRGILARPLREPWPDIVSWGGVRSLARTREALPDADDAACLAAFRRWRDESGLVLNTARSGVEVALPYCPVLALASERDDEVPLAATRALAIRLSADFEMLRGASHLGALLGSAAPAAAHRAADWIDAVIARETEPD